MKPKTPVAHLLGASLIAALGAQTATAATWNVWEGQDTTAPQIIYANTSADNGVVLICGPTGKLTSILTLEAADMPTHLEKKSSYQRILDAEFRMGDAAPTKTQVRYTPAVKTIQTESHNATAKIFNAAVTDQKLIVSMKRMGETVFEFPMPDAIFKAFADTCKQNRETPEEASE